MLSGGGIPDPLDMDNGQSDSGYVPRFERELAQAGSLKALSEAKKAENTDDSISVDNLDLSSLHTAEGYDESDDADKDEYDMDSADGLMTLGSYSADHEDNPHYQYHTKSQTEEERPAPKSIADFAREAEEQERALAEKASEQPENGLENISLESITLSDMDYDAKKVQSRSLGQQMQLDEIALNMGNRPVLEEMSDEYVPTEKNTVDLASKESLDKDEKQLIRERLEQEIGKRPEGYNKKTSLEMYHNLMREQKIKKAKKGFFKVLLLIALGLITAVITYFKLNWNDAVQAFDESGKLGGILVYLPIATAFFSLILFFKVKSVKVISAVYFAANTVILIGPGFIKFALDTNQQPGTYVATLFFYILAILMSAYICIQLCTSEIVEAYYTTHLLSEKKKVFDDRKSKYRQ